MMLPVFIAMLPAGNVPVGNGGVPQCPVRYETTFVSRISDLPDPIQSLVARGGKVADPGQDFEPSDDMGNPGLPRRRMVLAGHSGGKWFVWIDHGGFDRHNDIFGFTRLVEKGSAVGWHRSAMLQGDACIAINAFLDGVRTPDEIDR